MNKNKQRIKEQIMAALQINPRVSLKWIARQLGIPPSTAHDYLQQIYQEYVLHGTWVKQ